jgi:hypothetical protein
MRYSNPGDKTRCTDRRTRGKVYSKHHYLYTQALPAWREHFLANGLKVSEIHWAAVHAEREISVPDPDGYRVFVGNGALPNTSAGSRRRSVVVPGLGPFSGRVHLTLRSVVSSRITPQQTVAPRGPLQLFIKANKGVLCIVFLHFS